MQHLCHFYVFSVYNFNSQMQGCQHEKKNMGEVILQIPLLVQTYNIFKLHRWRNG